MKLIDLSPTRQGGSPVHAEHEIAQAFEAACEYVESLGSATFSQPDVFRACRCMPAVRQVFRSFLALGLIERISEPGSKPVFYRVAPDALPQAARA